jgi:hypothetical protein
LLFPFSGILSADEEVDEDGAVDPLSHAAAKGQFPSGSDPNFAPISRAI